VCQNSFAPKIWLCKLISMKECKFFNGGIRCKMISIFVTILKIYKVSNCLVK
jgi:hypothetical protein